VTGVQTPTAQQSARVHIAHRISSVAQPGAVLVSSTVKELVDGSDIEFDDLGTHQLKGVPRSRQLFTARL